MFCVHDEPTQARKRRQTFYHRVLRLSLASPDLVFKDLAESWLDVSEANGVTIWLYNAFHGEFQLNAVAGEIKGIEGLFPPVLRSSNMGEFAAKTRLPVLTGDVRVWRGTDGASEFRAALGTEFGDTLGFPCECCIPLLLPDENGELEGVSTCMGVVSLHYRRFTESMPAVLCGISPKQQTSSESRTSTWDEDSLILMGRLTASTLTNLRREEQLETANALAKLAERHITRYTEDPKQVRVDYLEAVIALLQERLKVSSVSIFCRVPLEDRIVCVVSTGLKRLEDNRILRRTELMEAWYTKELDSGSRTWKVFESGELVFLRTEGLHGKYLDLTRDGHPVHGLMLIFPIKHTQADKNTPPAVDDIPSTLGIIRCGHEVQKSQGCDLLTFDIVELETLAFIVDQISPVLHTLESRIQREEIVQVVKHDLLAPLAAIRDAVDHIYQDRLHDSKGDTYYLENLRELALRLGGMADLLSRNPSDRRKHSPQKTNLNSQIVAPMKRMLTPFAWETGRNDLRFDGVDQIPALNVDQSLIERALYNLIVNAVKYGERGTTIQIQGRFVEGGYALDVVNEGEGVDARFIPRLFSPYFRAPKARATRQGEGLGLAVVRGIMKSHGGDAVLVRAAGPTIFRLFFPAKLRA